jgi:hypothetical protein
MWFIFILVLFLGPILGCGDSPKREEGKDPFKGRQETQKEKAQNKFMKPKIPGGPKQ